MHWRLSGGPWAACFRPWANAVSGAPPIGVLLTWLCSACASSWVWRSSYASKLAPRSLFRAQGAKWDSAHCGAMSTTAALVLSLLVSVVRNASGCPRVEPESETATGGCGMWLPIGLMAPPKPPKNTVVDSVVKQASGTPNGGWVLPKLGWLRSKLGRVCSPCLPSPYWS